LKFGPACNSALDLECLQSSIIRSRRRGA